MHVRRLRAWLVRLAGLFGREARDRELAEELEFHLQSHVEDNIRAGMSPAEARRRALVKLGGVTQTEEKYRRQRGVPMLEDLWQDLRYGGRMLSKKPGFTLVAVLTLALGIGANTAIFSVINALILNPPNIAEPERVAAIWRTAKDKRAEGYVSYLELQDWRDRGQSFEAIAGYKNHGFILLNGEMAERVEGMRVTANFLPLLRVGLQRGRDFYVEEEKRGAQPAVIISHQFWQNRLGGGEDVLGGRLTLNGKPSTIIGVLPPGFEFPLGGKETDILATIAGEDGNL